MKSVARPRIQNEAWQCSALPTCNGLDSFGRRHKWRAIASAANTSIAASRRAGCAETREAKKKTVEVTANPKPAPTPRRSGIEKTTDSLRCKSAVVASAPRTMGARMAVMATAITEVSF